MIDMLSRWFFEVNAPQLEGESRLRASGLLAAAWLMILLLIAGMVVQLVTGGGETGATRFGLLNFGSSGVRGLILLILAALMLGSIVLLVKRGRYEVAAPLFILITLVVALVSFISRGATSPHVFVLFSLPIVAASVFGSRRTLVAMIGITIGIVALMTALTQAGILNSLSLRPAGLGEGAVLVTLALGFNGGLLVIALNRQRASRRSLALLTNEVRTLTILGKAALAAGPLDEALTLSLETLREHAGYYFAQVFLVEPDTRLLVLKAASGQTASQVASTRQRIVMGDPHILNSVMLAGASRRLDQHADADARVLFLPTTRTQVLFPLVYGKLALGVLDVQSVDADAFSPRAIQVLEMVAAQMALTVYTSRLIAQADDAERQRLRLTEQLQMTSKGGPDMLLSPTTQHLQGRLERVFGFDWHNGTILPNTTVSTAQRRALNNAMPETFQEQGEHGLTVPIMLRGSVLGVIEFRAARATGWNSRQIELARVIAQRLALALDNLRLFEQAQIAAQREQIASQLSARLQSRTEVDAVLALATEAFQEALGATRASIRFGVPEPTPPEVLSASAADADYGPNGNALRPEHGPERGPERGPQSQPQQESVQP